MEVSINNTLGTNYSTCPPKSKYADSSGNVIRSLPVNNNQLPVPRAQHRHFLPFCSTCMAAFSCPQCYEVSGFLGKILPMSLRDSWPVGVDYWCQRKYVAMALCQLHYDSADY
jgi:hypothetical protein